MTDTFVGNDYLNDEIAKTTEALDAKRPNGTTLRQWYKDNLGVEDVDELRNKMRNFYFENYPKMFALDEEGDIKNRSNGQVMYDIEQSIRNLPWDVANNGFPGLTFANLSEYVGLKPRPYIKTSDLIRLVSGETKPEDFYVVGGNTVNKKALQALGVDKKHFTKKDTGAGWETFSSSENIHAGDTQEIGKDLAENAESWNMFAERFFPGALDNYLEKNFSEEELEQIKPGIDKAREHLSLRTKAYNDYFDENAKLDEKEPGGYDDDYFKKHDEWQKSKTELNKKKYYGKEPEEKSEETPDSNDSEEVKDNPLKEMPVDDGEVSDDVADMDDIVEDDVEPAPEDEDLLSQEEVDELLKDVPRGNKDETIAIPEEEEDLSDEDIEKGVSSIEDSLDAASDIPAPDLATDEEVEAEDPEIKSSVSGLMDKLHLDKDKESKTKAEEDFENLANATPDPDPTDEDNVSYGKDETTMNTGEHIPDDDDSENLPAINAPTIRPTTQPDEYVPQQEEPAEKPNDDILDVEYSVEDLKPAEVPEEPQPEEPVEEKPKKEKKGSNALSDFLKSGIRDTSIDIDSSGEKYTPTKTTDPVVQVSDKKTKDYVRSNWDTPDSCLASDERLKKLFGDDDSIALIAKINSYDFKYKPEFQKAMGLDGDKHRGVIAQEVEANPAFEGCVGELENGTKVLKIPELTASNTAAVGDLAKRVEQLTDLVLEMKNMLGDRG